MKAKILVVLFVLTSGVLSFLFISCEKNPSGADEKFIDKSLQYTLVGKLVLSDGTTYETDKPTVITLPEKYRPQVIVKGDKDGKSGLSTECYTNLYITLLEDFALSGNPGTLSKDVWETPITTCYGGYWKWVGRITTANYYSPGTDIVLFANVFDNQVDYPDIITRIYISDAVPWGTYQTPWSDPVAYGSHADGKLSNANGDVTVYGYFGFDH